MRAIFSPAGMDMPIQQAKRALRQYARAVLGSLPESRRAWASEQACRQLRQQAIWRKARSILFFSPIAGEVDVWPLIPLALAAGKRVSLPRFVAETGSYIARRLQDPERELTQGQFGIREPLDHCPETALAECDLILVPGLAFDLQRRRLGRGKGYYDRWLAQRRGTACGVAFDEQVLPDIPVEPHDARLDCLLTPTRWIDFSTSLP